MSQNRSSKGSSNLVRLLHEPEYLLSDFAVTDTFSGAQCGRHFGIYHDRIFGCIICYHLTSVFKDYLATRLRGPAFEIVFPASCTFFRVAYAAARHKIPNLVPASTKLPFRDQADKMIPRSCIRVAVNAFQIAVGILSQ